jgi:hypothetical protein
MMMKNLTKMTMLLGAFLLAGQAYAGGLLGKDTLISNGSCITLKSAISGDATWSTGDKGNSIKVCPDGNTTVWVSIKKNGNTYTDTIRISVDSHPVLPGDANDDKKVSLTDVLKIGIAYGATGTARPGASNKWTKQAAYDWSKSFKSGVNYKHADCNGDGVVDTSDLAVIAKNFGKKSSGKTVNPVTLAGALPTMYLVANKDTFNPGDTAHIQIMFGTATQPANNTYGVSFQLQFNPANVLPGSMMLKTGNSWLSIQPNDLMAFNNTDYNSGLGNLAISRMNQVAVSGNGKIGDMTLVVKGDVVGKDEVARMLQLNIVEPQAIDPDENITDLNSENLTLAINDKATSVANTELKANHIKVYPNPSNGNFTIDLQNGRADRIEITDVMGRTQVIINQPQGSMINVSSAASLAKGMYVVRVYNGNNITVTPITIAK